MSTLRFRPEPRPIEQVAHVVVHPPDGSAARTGRLTIYGPDVFLTIDPASDAAGRSTPVARPAGVPIPELGGANGYDVAVDLIPQDDKQAQTVAEALYERWWVSCKRAVAEQDRLDRWRREQEAERERLAAELAERAAAIRDAVCGHEPRAGFQCDRERGHHGPHRCVSTDGVISRLLTWDDDGLLPEPPNSAPESDFVAYVADTRCRHAGPHAGRRCVLEAGHDGDHGCNFIGGGIAQWLTWPTEVGEQGGTRA